MNIGIVLHVLWLTLVVTCAESSSVHKYLKKPVEKGDWRWREGRDGRLATSTSNFLGWGPASASLTQNHHALLVVRNMRSPPPPAQHGKKPANVFPPPLRPLLLPTLPTPRLLPTPLPTSPRLLPTSRLLPRLLTTPLHSTLPPLPPPTPASLPLNPHHWQLDTKKRRSSLPTPPKIRQKKSGGF